MLSLLSGLLLLVLDTQYLTPITSENLHHYSN